MTGLVEPYPSEMPKIHHAFAQLQRRFSSTRFTDSSVEEFQRAAVELFGAVGFEVDVAWDQVYKNGRPTETYMPEVTISGRVRNEDEVDHDRMKHEIRAGLADGKVGVVDPNTGDWREDSKKKMIL